VNPCSHCNWILLKLYYGAQVTESYDLMDDMDGEIEIKKIALEVDLLH
jgi:hypothetical protein